MVSVKGCFHETVLVLDPWSCSIYKLPHCNLHFTLTAYCHPFPLLRMHSVSPFCSSHTQSGCLLASKKDTSLVWENKKEKKNWWKIQESESSYIRMQTMRRLCGLQYFRLHLTDLISVLGTFLKKGNKKMEQSRAVLLVPSTNIGKKCALNWTPWQKLKCLVS